MAETTLEWLCGDWDWFKTSKKLGADLLIVLLTGALVVWQDDPRWIMVVPFAKAALDFLKHR